MHKQTIHKPHFENLDALRFFAFFSVFISHCVYRYNYVFPQKSLQLLNLHFFANGNLGVNFFFVLSGFLISWLLFLEKEGSGTVNIRDFYIRRVLRIWPVYFLVVAAGFFVAMVVCPYFLDEKQFIWRAAKDSLPRYAFFLANFDLIRVKESSHLLSVLWSVSVEEQFYLVWPLLFFFLSKKAIPVLCWIIIAVSFAYRFFYALEPVYKFSTFSVMSDLAMGCLAAYYAMYSPAFKARIKHQKRTTILLVYLLLFIYIPLHGMSHYFGDTVFRVYYPFESLLFSSFFAYIILEQNFSDNSFFKFGRISVFSRLGKISYGLYAYHMFTFPVAFYVTIKLGLPDEDFISYLLKIALSLTLTIAISLLSYNLFEKKFLMLKQKFSSLK